MVRLGLTAVYGVGLVAAEAFRWRGWRLRRRSRQAGRLRTRHALSAERVVLLGIVAGIWVLPLVYACTNWLGAADYTLPVWAGWLGTGLLAVSLIVRREAHRALGSHWSPTLETADGQSLVTRGIYAHARHPMYASLVLWAAAQPMLLQNLLAGWGGVVAVSLIWLIRVPREEAMMVERFGDAYREYMARTGRFVS